MRRVVMKGASLSNPEKLALMVLAAIDGPADIEAVYGYEGEQSFRDEQEARGSLSWITVKELAIVDEETTQHYRLTGSGRSESIPQLPESRAFSLLEDGETTMGDLKDAIGGSLVGPTIGHLKKLGVKVGGGKLAFSGDQSEVLSVLEERQQFVAGLTDWVSEKDLDGEMLKVFIGRKGVLEKKEQVYRTWALNDAGRALVEAGLEFTAEVGQLTPELLKDGSWKEKTFRSYDVHTFAPGLSAGRRHPLVRMIHEIRGIFLRMGFDEIEGNYAQSCFWNMDTLFIPQDHPAREMQDTFYLSNPATIVEEDDEVVSKIKNIHENGGDTGSRGWQYDWSRDEANRAILRTHTTVNTIRYLSEHQEPPIKVFGIGKVFRKESIDATHLPEFTQIEGIIVEENASFNMLVGVFKEFFGRLGFDKLRFRPAYFPYTEPSLEIEVWWKGRFLELGGAGVFRPEVVEPFGVKHPVLAWGLGLERLAMLRLGLDDIRDLYLSDIQWLRSVAL